MGIQNHLIWDQLVEVQKRPGENDEQATNQLKTAAKKKLNQTLHEFNK
jgi:hypothetical protein